MTPIPPNVPWRLLAFLSFLLAVAIAYSYGRHHGTEAERGKQATAEARAAAKARGAEEGWRAAVYNLSYDATKSRIDRERSFAETLAAVRARAIRVRPRLHCLSGPARPASGNDDPPAGAEQPAGVPESDIAVVLHIGNDADAVSERLKMCQDYVRIIKKPRPR